MPMESLQGVFYLFGGDYFATKNGEILDHYTAPHPIQISSTLNRLAKGVCDANIRYLIQLYRAHYGWRT